MLCFMIYGFLVFCFVMFLVVGTHFLHVGFLYGVFIAWGFDEASWFKFLDLVMYKSILVLLIYFS